MSRLPDWLLERYAAGDLPDAQKAEVAARLRAEDGGEQRLADLVASNAELLAKLPPAAVAAEVARRHAVAQRLAQTRRSSSRGPRWWMVALPVVGTAGLILVLQTGPGGDVGSGARHPRGARTGSGQATGASASSPDDEVIGIKGGARVLVFRKRGDKQERLRDGARAQAGDVLQLAYVSGGRPFGAILSVDGKGVVTPHLPEATPAGAEAVALEGSGRVTLPHAYQLDAAPAFERFVFVTADRGFAIEPVAQALAAGKPLPEGLSQMSVTLQKGTP